MRHRLGKCFLQNF